MLNEREFLDYNSYLRKCARTNSEFALEKFFSITDVDILKCENLIKEIENINDEIKNTTKADKRNDLNRKKGKLLEKITFILLDSAQLYTIKTNVRDHTNEIDLLLIPSDYNKIHKILLPDYLCQDILIECKNYNKNIKVDWVGKFASLMNTHKVMTGIIFSYKDFSGPSEWSAAKGFTKKLFLSEKHAILNINFEDIEKVLNKELNIVQLIKYKYDALKHHIDYSKLITKHPAEL